MQKVNSFSYDLMLTLTPSLESSIHELKTSSSDSCLVCERWRSKRCRCERRRVSVTALKPDGCLPSPAAALYSRTLFGQIWHGPPAGALISPGLSMINRGTHLNLRALWGSSGIRRALSFIRSSERNFRMARPVVCQMPFISNLRLFSCTLFWTEIAV